MPIYTYETVAQNGKKGGKTFEVKQSIHDAPLRVHPETGQPIKRVITGGAGILTSKSSGAASTPPPAVCCGGGACRH